MKNNDIIRRIRFVFNLDDSKMMKLCSSPERKVSRAEISDWLKRDDDIGHKEMNDNELAIFLNHFIEEKRGKRDGPAPVAETRLSNNLIFMKLKIALNLKAEDVLDILSVAGFKLGKHELSAFFRKPGHKHFRTCQDQVLRNFLQGMQEKYRKDIDQIKAKAPAEKKVFDSADTEDKAPAKKDSVKKSEGTKAVVKKQNAPAPVAYQWKQKPDSE